MADKEVIEVEGEVLFPNMDLLFENEEDGKVYRLVSAVDDKRFI